MTRREQMESAGDFATAVFKAARSGTVKSLVKAYCVADDPNREQLLRVFPGLDLVARLVHDVWGAQIANGIGCLWPGAQQAAENPDEPTNRARWQERRPHEEGKLLKIEAEMKPRAETEVQSDGP